MTSYLDTSYISIRETFCWSLEIWCNGVILWCHTLFFYIFPYNDVMTSLAGVGKIMTSWIFFDVIRDFWSYSLLPNFRGVQCSHHSSMAWVRIPLMSGFISPNGPKAGFECKTIRIIYTFIHNCSDTFFWYIYLLYAW